MKVVSADRAEDPHVGDVVVADAPTPRGSGRAGLRFRGMGLLLNLVMVALLAYLILVPLAILIYSSLKPTTTDLPFQVPGFGLGNYSDVFSSGRIGTVSLNTGIYVVGSLVVALVLSVGLAYLFERTDMPGRRFLAPLALAPLAVPVTVMAIAWALVANPANGPLAVVLRETIGFHLDIYSLAGMIIVMGIFGIPSMYLMIAPAFAQLNPELEEAAAATGAPLWRRLRLIVFPLIGPAVSAAGMLLVVIALEGFAIPAILGLPHQIFVYSNLIQYSLQPPSGLPDYGQASAYGVLILVLSLAMLLVYRRRVRDADRYKVVTGKGYRQRPTPLGKWRIPMTVIVSIFMFVGVVLPILALVWTSLSPYSRPFTISGLRSLTFAPYTRVLSAPDLPHVLINTTEVVLITATATTALSLWIAIAAARRMFWGSGFLFESTFLVMGIPSVVLGSAVLFLYLFVPIPIYGTVWIIIVALTTRFLARGARVVQTALLQIDEGLLEAGRAVGASPVTVTRKILLPLLSPALWRLWLWVFAHALGELPIALLLTGADNKTLIVMLWDTYTSSVDYPEASALAVIIMLISTVAVWVVNRRGAPREG